MSVRSLEPFGCRPPEPAGDAPSCTLARVEGPDVIMHAVIMHTLALWALLAAQLIGGAAAQAGPLTEDAVNAAQWAKPQPRAKHLDATVLKAQVLLGRAGFSPGAIDARGGENFVKALKAFQEKNGLETNGKLDEGTWSRLVETSSAPVVVAYEIKPVDAKGPFVKRIPKDYEEMAELEHLGYRSPRELLAEKFHMTENLLAALNKGKRLEAGTTVLVANADPEDAGKNGRGRADANTGTNRREPGRGQGKAAKVEVRKGERAVRVYAEDGSLIAYYPASIGSAEKPAPSGAYEVRAVAKDPTYRYNPAYAFKGQKATEPVEIAPGPNNPVGAVWIALSAESYGIHGTPDPEAVSKTASHGCIRLTNWDALALARMVRKGTPVVFVD
jgi:lipoprotein-anchoring transpeptidase ErfK/SrfK